MTTTTGIRNTWPALAAGPGAKWRQARRALQDWRQQRARYRATLRELLSLGPRERADIGIAPADIPRIAREESLRR